jgi:hypothetical protein
MTETVTLGGRQFELRPLKLGQLRHVLDALDALAGKSGGALIEAAAHIVAAGLAPAHPDIDSAAVLDLQAGLEELNAAVAAILRAAGLTPVGEARPAASEAAAPAGSSPPSTPPSPPAAATATP